jgi:hypothetical protein
MNKRRVVARVVSLFWIAGSALLLLGLSALIVGQKNFPLDFGLVRTRGLNGLWTTLLPGVVGLAGAALLRPRKVIGSCLVAVYSGYWTVLLASGIPAVWNAKSSFCLNGLGLCITTPWLGRAVLIGLISAFALTGLWAWQDARSRTA